MAAHRAIVLGVDFSECSRAALDAAAGLARDLKAPIVLVHAFGSVPAPALAGSNALGGPAYPVEFQTELEMEEAEELTQQWASLLRGEGLEVEVVAARDKGAHLVLEAAKRADAALIVVGTHGRSGLRRIGLGSVAQELVRKSPIPVLVVPHGR